MKRAISMRCNQEQWDSIKGKLVGLTIYVDSRFESFPFLVNNSGGDLCVINNFSSFYKRDRNREVHETWNEKVFLEACGIETEKTFKGSELQFWNCFDEEWNDCSSKGTTYRLKPDYSKEIAELERQIEILKNK